MQVAHPPVVAGGMASDERTQQMPRWYQQAAVERAIAANSILALETGQGKVKLPPLDLVRRA